MLDMLLFLANAGLLFPKPTSGQEDQARAWQIEKHISLAVVLFRNE